MHASKFGYLLLAAVAFSTPACFTVDKSDDDDGGESGDDSGGSSGKGGSSSGNGGSTSGSGGSSSGSGGSSSGSGGSTSGSGGSASGSGGSGGGVVGSCDGNDLNLAVECPAGTTSEFEDPDCNNYFRCTFGSICSSGGLSCNDCEVAIVSELTAEEVCIPNADFENIGVACLQAAASLADMYPECAPSGN
jgi:hypothetical protein